jgi:hypothetical protein
VSVLRQGISHKYEAAITEILGGTGRTAEVLPRVEEKLRPQLSAIDYEKDSRLVRWVRATHSAAARMQKSGRLRLPSRGRVAVAEYNRCLNESAAVRAFGNWRHVQAGVVVLDCDYPQVATLHRQSAPHLEVRG